MLVKVCSMPNEEAAGIALATALEAGGRQARVAAKIIFQSWCPDEGSPCEHKQGMLGGRGKSLEGSAAGPGRGAAMRLKGRLPNLGSMANHCSHLSGPTCLLR